MSGDEAFVTVLGGMLGSVLWATWLLRSFYPSPLLSLRSARWPLWLWPLAAQAGILIILVLFSAADVRGAPPYLAMYALLGLAWTALAVRAFPLLGLDAPTDIAQRGNPAAKPLFSGALLGSAAAYAGGNIGDGPGWSVVVFSAGLATAALLAAWAALNALARGTERVVIDRDVPTGRRVGAVLLALGLVFGRGVAGTWRGPLAAVNDFFAIAAPAPLLILGETLLARLLRPAPARPTAPPFRAGTLPAMVTLAASIVYILWLGWWT